MTDDAHEPEQCWPPRPAELLSHALAPLEDLSLDMAAVPAPRPEFAAGKLEGHPAARIAGDPVDRAARAVAFDSKNPSGRSRCDRLFDVRDEDFAAEKRALTWKGALIGTGIFLLPVILVMTFTWTAAARAAVAGAIVGVVAARWFDGAVGWSAACLVGSAMLLPLVSGPPFFVLAGFLCGLGWLAGFLRETG